MQNIKIRIANMKLCRDQDCRVVKGVHLVVLISTVQLSTSQAVAISYAWGAFGRKRIEIGHDTENKIYMMELGQEWDVDELCRKLASICHNNGTAYGREHAA